MANEYKVNFQENLKSQRRLLTPEKREKTQNPKTPIWLYPFADERSYNAFVKREVLKPGKDIYKPEVEQNYTKWNREVNADTHWDLEEKYVKVDQGFTDDLKELIRQLGENTNEIFGTNIEDPEQTLMWASLLGIAAGVFDFNKKQWQKQTKSVLGFPFETDESWRQQAERQWAQENFTLIKGISEEQTRRVNEIVSRGVRNGTLTKDIIAELQQLDKTMKNRAELIAKDQIGKLNGKIAELRQTEAGIDFYEWQTAKDERVRGNPAGKYPKAIPSHWIMQGMICRWDDNMVFADPATDVDKVTGKITWRSRTGKMPIAIPGEEIRCRCVGTPYWPSVISEADKEL